MKSNPAPGLTEVACSSGSTTDFLRASKRDYIFFLSCLAKTGAMRPLKICPKSVKEKRETNAMRPLLNILLTCISDVMMGKYVFNLTFTP